MPECRLLQAVDVCGRLVGHLPVQDLDSVEARLDRPAHDLLPLGEEEATFSTSRLFAATYPQRTRALLLYGTFSCATPRPGVPAQKKAA